MSMKSRAGPPGATLRLPARLHLAGSSLLQTQEPPRTPGGEHRQSWERGSRSHSAGYKGPGPGQTAPMKKAQITVAPKETSCWRRILLCETLYKHTAQIPPQGAYNLNKRSSPPCELKTASDL
ncbi:hypothetical protein Y1Q_0015558 [Alligator mississippiensis]|uniref:Uncharacterized protein n=1 Tax=Alligator mississippiensis TaxID=8496 RepID=A0A151NN81_ALLMI|nr:hypothetical protein Y1Q_0015558 [Alligator mississippiensis]